MRDGVGCHLDLGGLRLHQLNDMVDHVGVLDMVVGDAAEIDHIVKLVEAKAAEIEAAGNAVAHAAE